MKKIIRLMILIVTATLLIFAIYNIYSSASKASDNRSGASNASDIADSRVYKVVVDPGHGGKDRGATGASGHYEKDFTLQLAQKVKELSEQETQFEVYMTRTDDTFISTVDRKRPEFAKRQGADLFISIHGNTYDDPDVSGTETYYYHEESLPLAKIMHKQVVEATGFRDRDVKKEDYFVPKDTDMPAVLLEVGYLTNPQDEEQLLMDDVQYRIAASIVDGIKEYLKMK
ncbi:N-acetylmuramoyl-L-alanine amidase [Brevibacillus sp. B_LB10_24]|uniref:N-acetylmuramoyl-L-alanine amidase family protein n=1 Tax=Brevibacillus sp. B_LB10_24 TaxID=3380645 RepID=UPI0038B8E39C